MPTNPLLKPLLRPSIFGAIVMLVAFSASAALADLPEPVIAPLIFEKPGGRFETIWFHPQFHNTNFSNLTGPSAGPATTPGADDRQYVAVSRLEPKAPYAVYRVGARIYGGDLYPSEPGTFTTPLLAQVSQWRDSITAHPSNLAISLPDSFQGEFGDAWASPAISFSSPSPLFVGLQWQAGYPRSPQVSQFGGVGTFKTQQVVYRSVGGDVWTTPASYFGMNVDLLSWKPDAVTPPESIENSAVAFKLWYQSDTTLPLSQNFASVDYKGDTLAWPTANKGDGYITLVAYDQLTSAPSSVTRLRFETAKVGKLAFSSQELIFDWRFPLVASQPKQLAITNSSLGAAKLTVKGSDSRVTVDSAALTIAALKFSILAVGVSGPPPGGVTERYSLFITNDRGWYPVKLDIINRPDQTTDASEDDPPLPQEFALSEVYPNPTRGSASLKITAPERELYRVEVFNLLGQMVFTDQTQAFGEVEYSFDLPASASSGDLVGTLSSGVYFVRISNESEALMKKFVFLR